MLELVFRAFVSNNTATTSRKADNILKSSAKYLNNVIMRLTDDTDSTKIT